jgi:O-methyltransferase
MTAQLRSDYLDLMEDVLTNSIYGDPDMEYGTFDAAARAIGKDWPSQAHTMIGKARMRNLRDLVETVIAEEVPGDLIETGVWRGGACIYMRAMLKAFAITDRTVWVADSFKGVPPPDPEYYPADKGDIHHTVKVLAVSQAQVEANFAKYGLLDAQVQFISGWFGESLPDAPMTQLAVIRLDGDMYESTMDGLLYLYGKLSKGGYVIVDDYLAIPACRQAVTDYREEHHIVDAIVNIDQDGVYWKKTGEPS